VSDQDVPTVSDAGEAYARTVADVLEKGHPIVAGRAKSTGSERDTHELLNYGFRIQYPRERLPWRDGVDFKLPMAVARFVWMMAKNDRLSDIEFYASDRMRNFSDDGILVPGSSYGKRMLDARPGLDQIAQVIRRLKEDPSTRRAAVSIYQAEDAARESKDIPCAFGMVFNIRESRMHTTVLMRSNNASKLLQYNLFEFSMLAEAVASECDVAFGPLYYHAVSMHVYDEPKLTDEMLSKMLVERPDRVPMPTISRQAPMQQIRELVKLEAQARSHGVRLSDDALNGLIADCDAILVPYWRQFFYVLLVYIADRANLETGLDRLHGLLNDPWRAYLPQPLSSGEASRPAKANETFAKPSPATIRAETPIGESRLKSLEERCMEQDHLFQEAGRPSLSFSEFRSLRTNLVTPPDELLLAARDLQPIIERDEFRAALEKIRPS